jgi:hypothetical protein
VARGISHRRGVYLAPQLATSFISTAMSLIWPPPLVRGLQRYEIADVSNFAQSAPIKKVQIVFGHGMSIPKIKSPSLEAPQPPAGAFILWDL